MNARNADGKFVSVVLSTSTLGTRYEAVNEARGTVCGCACCDSDVHSRHPDTHGTYLLILASNPWDRPGLCRECHPKISKVEASHDLNHLLKRLR